MPVFPYVTTWGSPIQGWVWCQSLPWCQGLSVVVLSYFLTKKIKTSWDSAMVFCFDIIVLHWSWDTVYLSYSDGWCLYSLKCRDITHALSSSHRYLTWHFWGAFPDILVFYFMGFSAIFVVLAYHIHFTIIVCVCLFLFLLKEGSVSFIFVSPTFHLAEYRVHCLVFISYWLNKWLHTYPLLSILTFTIQLLKLSENYTDFYLSSHEYIPSHRCILHI